MREIGIYLNAPVLTGIRSDNLRGELRWERCVLDALLHSEQIDEIYTVIPARPADSKNRTCIFADSWHIAKNIDARGILIHTAGGPGEEERELMAFFRKEYGKRFVFTNTVRSDDKAYMDNLKDIIGEDHVEPMLSPVVPEVTENNNFDNKIILWPHRNINHIFRGEYGTDRKDVQKNFEWIASKLEEDSEMKLYVMTGWSPQDYDFYKCDRSIWRKNSYTECLTEYEDRIQVFDSLNWEMVLFLYSKAKIITGFPPGPRGNVIVEAAAYGIPSIGGTRFGALKNCPNYLGAEYGSDEYFDLLDRLYTDREFYTSTLNSYKQYIEKNHTYSAFVDSLLGILERRDMI